MIKGIEITLYDKTQTGTDDFGAPVYTESEIKVANVLVGEPSSDDIISSNELYGRKVAYTLAIPKGDTNKWVDREVSFFGQRFRTIGEPTEGIEENIPLYWNKKVKVERYG